MLKTLLFLSTVALISAGCKPSQKADSAKSNGKLSAERIIQLDRSQLDFSPDGKGVNEDLWKENQSLSLGDFYHKYQKDFESYNIHLTFRGTDLISEEGAEYHPYTWGSQFEKDLTAATNDHYKSRVIGTAYLRHIQPVLATTPTIDQSFKWFIFKYHVYFGSDLVPIKSKLSLYSDFEPFFKSKDHIRALSAFFKEVSDAFPKRPPSQNGKVKIAVITGPYGGGHVSTASVFEQAVQGNENFSITKVNECVDFEDSLFIVTRKKDSSGNYTGYRACKIYNDISVSEGNQYKATLLYILNSKVAEYIPQNRFHQVFEKLKEINTDIIISTVHHIEEVTANAYMLDRPLRIVVTDYEFPFKQWFHLNHIDSELIKYWVPTMDYKGFFRSMVKDYVVHRWDTRLKSSRSNILYENVFQGNRSLAEVGNQLGVFEYLPFPVSPTIEAPANQNEISASRRVPEISLTTQLDRKVVTIALGGSPNPDAMGKSIEQILRIAPRLGSRIQIAVLSSGKQPVIDRATEIFSSAHVPVLDPPGTATEVNDPITARIFRFLRYPQEMALLYKASDVIISKSGGASTAEFINSRTPFIRGFSLWPWEIENTKYLETLGLSYSSKGQPADILTEDLSVYASDVSDQEILAQMVHLFSLDGRPNVGVARFENHQFIHLIDVTKRSFHQIYDRETKKRSRLQSVSHQIKAGVKDEANQEVRFELLETVPFSAGADAEVFHAEQLSKQSNWVLKLSHASSRDGNLIDTEYNTFRFLRRIIPNHVPQVIRVSDDSLLKSFVKGKTLFEKLRDDEMTEELSESLYQLFKTLCQQQVYVRGLHGYKLIYSDETHQWVIIDSNGYVERDRDVYESYYQELSAHWLPEFETNHPRSKPSLTDPILRQRVAKIREILLERLHRKD